MKKWIFRSVLLLLLTLVVAFVFFVYPKLPIINGYAAKRACSCLYVADRNLETIEQEELEAFPQNLASLQVDDSRKAVSASTFGMRQMTSVYRPGLGCKLIIDDDDHKAQYIPQVEKKNILPSSAMISYSTVSVSVLSDDKIKQVYLALEAAFDTGDSWEKKTRAMLVMHKGSILAEKYRAPHDKDTPFLGWSMTKSVCNILVGILVKEGKLNVQQDNLFPEWAEDERSKITLDNLLRMNSGLEWNEAYGTESQVTEMLFLEESAAEYARASVYEFAPGQVWEYSSGTTNLIGRLIKNTFDKEEDYYDFPKEALFDKLDMHGAQMETDEQNEYVMSSFMYATTRDWAKLGRLYLDEGVVNGGIDTIFTKEWHDYSLRVTPQSEGRYGAHIWLNGEPKDYPSCPADTYKFSGYEGQYVVMIPSLDLVVVRLGLGKDFPFDKVLGEIIAAME